MGNCFSSSAASPDANGASREDKERSYAIDKQIDDDAKKFRRECKILLLGQFQFHPFYLAPSPVVLLTGVQVGRGYNTILERVRD